MLSYSDVWKTGVGGQEYLTTLNLLGYCYLMTKQYPQANEVYQRELKARELADDRENQAKTYHQLGRVAQELREYAEARSHYQQALDIKIEYQDRYSQASTYSQLGLLSESLKDFEQAQLHHLEDLRICVEFNDQRRMTFTLGNLNRVYSGTQEEQLLSAVAEILDSTPEDVRQIFANLSEDE